MHSQHHFTVVISNSGHAKALIFSEISYLVGPNNVKGAKNVKNEPSFKKMNIDFTITIEFFE